MDCFYDALARLNIFIPDLTKHYNRRNHTSSLPQLYPRKTLISPRAAVAVAGWPASEGGYDRARVTGRISNTPSFRSLRRRLLWPAGTLFRGGSV